MALKGIVVVMFVSIILSLLLLLGLFILVLKQLCNKTMKTQPCDKYCILIAFVFGITYNITTFVIILAKKSSNAIFAAIRVLFLHVCAYIVYIILLSRVYYSFKGSVHEVRKCVLYLHGFNLIIMIILNVCRQILLYTERISYDTFLLTGIAWKSLILVGYTHLLYMFNYKLFLLVLSKRKTITMSNNQMELSGHQLNILTIIRKHTILGSFMMFSGILTIVITILVNFATTESQAFLFRNLLGICILIFVDTSPVCLFLGFQHNRDLYRRLCSCCDRKCKNKCDTMAEKRLNKQYNYKQMNDTQSLTLSAIEDVNYKSLVIETE